MHDFLENSAFFGVFVSILSYGIGMLLKKKWKLALLNPLLIAIVVTILVLTGMQISYEKYYAGAKYLSYLLTPATVCLAIPLYEQLELLKRNCAAIFIGIASGVLTSLGGVLGMSFLFHFSHKEYVTMLPKSITTAIGMGISERLGGYVAISVAAIIITGVLGNIFAELLFRVFRISEPIAKGVSLGTASHAIGTAKAMEIGKVEGAMSSLSIVVAGLITVGGASIFAKMM